MRETILVTGGAGYIGSIAIKELVRSNFNIIAVDSLENGHREAVVKEARLEIADSGEKKRMAKIFDMYHPVAVIDFAAYLAVGESMEDPKKYLKNNVANFINLLDIMVRSGCKYLVKSSTASVYGSPTDKNDFPLRESYTNDYRPKQSNLLFGKFNGRQCQGEAFFKKFMALYYELIIDRPELSLDNKELTSLRIPTSIYGLTKLLDEIIMKKYDKLFGLKYISLRYFNVAGADPSGQMGEDKPNPTHLITLAVYQAVGKRDYLKVFGTDYPTKDGTGIRDYIHVVDLARGHIQALEYIMRNKKSEILNLGTGDGFSVLDVISAVEETSGRKIKYQISPRRTGDPAISYADPSRAIELLGWKSIYTLKDMADSAYSWHSSHINGYEG